MTDTVAQILKEVREALLIAQSRGLHESYFADFAEASEIKREESQINMALAKLDRLEVVDTDKLKITKPLTATLAKLVPVINEAIYQVAALGAVVKVKGE